MSYQQFIERKSQLDGNHGFKPLWIPDFLYPFQAALVEWALLKGRGALFEDCGLGKTPQQLVWAENVCRKTDGKVLILTPLAVAAQTVREGDKFGIDVQQSTGKVHPRITVTNYDQLHHFNATDFDGVVADESGILKNFDGKTKDAIVEFMRTRPYRLLATATAAPNDFIELGNSSEALGEMGFMDMLGRFFKQDTDKASTMKRFRGESDGRVNVGGFGKWRFRGHSQQDFWRWVCSWARAITKPSDIGFADDEFILPPLEIRQHVIQSPPLPSDELIRFAAQGLKEQRDERRQTIDKRCEKTAELVLANDNPSLSWCHLNPEGDLLEKLIPDCVQVSGSDSTEEKEEKIMAFITGQVKRMVSKPSVCGLGLNLQHCAHQTFFPSHSFEQWYQGIRRSWRFGQKNPVTVDVITSEGESKVLANLQRKQIQCEVMFSRLVELMNNGLKIQRDKNYNLKPTKPSWL